MITRYRNLDTGETAPAHCIGRDEQGSKLYSVPAGWVPVEPHWYDELGYAHEGEHPGVLFCEPWESGLRTSRKAIALRLGKLLTALSDIGTSDVKGTLPRELRDFRISIHERLKAEGWRVIQLGQQGWEVLPPKGK